MHRNPGRNRLQLAICIALAQAPVEAAQWLVANTDDSGPGSLRDAITIASADDTITFAPQLTGSTITLSSGELSPPVSMTIDGDFDGSGDGIPDITISSDGSSRIFNIGATGIHVTLNSLVISGGVAYSQDAQTGGGIHVTNARTTIRNSTISGNNAVGGGGIYAAPNGEVLLVRSSVTNNTAFAAGGIAGLFNASVEVRESTISGNSDGLGVGGMELQGATALVANSTISGNVGVGVYGFQNSILTLENSTILDNGNATYGNLVLEDGSVATISNSIIAGPRGGSNCLSTGSTITDAGTNWFDDTSCNGTDSGAPDLGPLQDNGGPTLTHRPSPTSPVIDAGNDATCQAFDQRGIMRPSDGDDQPGSTCDIGAIEVANTCVVAPATFTIDGTLTPVDLDSPGAYLAEAMLTTTGSVTVTGTGKAQFVAGESVGFGNRFGVLPGGEMSVSIDNVVCPPGS